MESQKGGYGSKVKKKTYYDNKLQSIHYEGEKKQLSNKISHRFKYLLPFKSLLE
jgi:hypothetical protein